MQSEQGIIIYGITENTRQEIENYYIFGDEVTQFEMFQCQLSRTLVRGVRIKFVV